MNDSFFELPQDKQTSIINSAMKVFSKYKYKNATTDEIVKTAGISKGLLFYYFGNKKGLYIFLYNYARDFLVDNMKKYYNSKATDFFEILVDAQMAKIKALEKHPDVMDFIMQSYFETDKAVVDDINRDYQQIISGSSARFLSRADMSKFKDGVDPQKVLNIIIWMADGFMSNKTHVLQEPIDYEEINNEYIDYLNFMKQSFYKEEYLK